MSGFRLIFCCLIFLSQQLVAATWDEPWMDKVITDADSFVKVSITKSTPKKFSAEVIKHLAGKPTPRKFEVVGFSMLQLGSISSGSDELSLKFNPELKYYLFLKGTKKKSQYLIATPETGWAKIIPAGVNATYRHSYHQALIPEDIYEMSMVAIFDHLHGKASDTSALRRFMHEHLSTQPALLGKANGDPEIAKEFFDQHAALESFRYFGIAEMLPLLDPFLSADDFHVQTSAVRALLCVDSAESRKRTVDFIASKRHGFAKIMALWNLEAWNAKEHSHLLQEYLQKGEDEKTGFGGNVMDPRIGTTFPPSVKNAISQLLKKWDPHL